MSPDASFSSNRTPAPIGATGSKNPTELAAPCLIQKYGQGAVGKFCHRCNSVVRQDGSTQTAGGCNSHTQY